MVGNMINNHYNLLINCSGIVVVNLKIKKSLKRILPK